MFEYVYRIHSFEWQEATHSLHTTANKQEDEQSEREKKAHTKMC